VPTPGARRTRFLVSAAVAVLLVVALVVVNLELFVWPQSDSVGHADAVVVLGGGDGERLDRGLALMSEGVAPTLVASTVPSRMCNADLSFDVICFVPDPNTTRGEAEAIAKIADGHGWKRLVLVTSTYHVTRAEMLLDRCYPGTVEIAPATPNTGVLAWFSAIVHEWGGLAEAAVERSC
jgi:uncharacterized SAM-binding protein YcdF (DUF218 family)